SNVTLLGGATGSAAFAFVTSGGQALGMTIGANGSAFVIDAEADGVTVKSGGVLVISSGGFVSGVTVSSGGTISLGAFGAVAGLVLSSGAHEFIHQAVGGDQTVSGITVSSGNVLEVDSAGSATSVTVLSGGELEYAGGIVTSATIRSGGYESINSGAFVSGLVIARGVSLFVNSGVAG